MARRFSKVWAALSAFITVAVAVVLILPVAGAFATTATISAVKTGNPPTYKLGETLVLSATAAPDSGSPGLGGVMLHIQGPQPLTIALPTAVGANQNLTANLPKDAQNNALGTLFVDVTAPSGFGYGYGYGGNGISPRNYTIRYTPPIFKFPTPPALSGPPNNPTPAFTIGQGAGGGAESLQTTLLFSSPGSPMNEPGDAIRGLAYGFDPNVGSVLFVLVDGGGADDDAVLLVDSFGGFLYDFIDTNVTDAEGVTVLNEDVFVLVKGPGSSKVIKKVRDNSPTSNNIGAVNATIPLGNVSDTLLGMGLATGFVGITPEFRAADFQSNAAAKIPVRRFTANGASNPTIEPPSGPTGGGYNALAFATINNQGLNLGAKGNKIALFDDTGFVQSVKSVTYATDSPLSDIQGLEFANGCLYVADGGSVYQGCDLGSNQQQGPSQNPPLDIAATGDKLFILVENSVNGVPNDKVIVTDKAGANPTEFTLGFGNVESLAVMAVGGTTYLWFVDNDFSGPRLVKRNLDGTSPALPHTFDLPNFVGSIGDLTAKSGKLVLAEQFNNAFHIVSSTGGLENTFSTPFGGQVFSFGNEGLALQTEGGSQLWGAKYTALPRFNPTNGSLLGTDFVNPGQPPFDISGLADDGSTLWMTDRGTNQVFKSTFPGAPAVELTTVGDYTAMLKVMVNNVNTESQALSFTYQKITALTIAITSPANNAGVGEATVTVQGTVNDPTVKQLNFGAELSEVVLFGNAAKDGASTFETTADQNQYGKNGLWRVVENINGFQGSPAIAGKVAQYGKDGPGGFDFSTGAPNAGDLDTASFLVGEGSKLSFKTKWDTEPGFQFDKKLIQFCETNGPCTTLGQITGDAPPDQFGFPNFNAAPGTVYQFFGNFPGAPTHKMIFVPQFGPGLVNVALDLPTNLVGKSGVIRFKFDSFDAGGNDGDGWLLDDIVIEGKGGSTDSIPVNADGTWSKDVTLSEGENVITVSGQRTAYTPILNASASVTVFFDNINPVVDLANVTTPTNVAIQTISGTYVEQTPEVLEILVNNKVVSTQKSAFTGTFSQAVSLAAGTNTIKVQVQDKSGKTGSDTATIVLDQTGATISVLSTIYPVGQVSARSSASGATDQVVVPVIVSDALAGVEKVIYQKAGTNDTTAPQLLKYADIPPAVLGMWGVPTNATHVLITNVPTGLPPSTISLGIKAFDKANNTSTANASVTIVATLEQFNLYLLPGYNFIGAPLPCLDAAVSSNTCNADNSFKIDMLLEQVVTNPASGFDPDSNSTTPVKLKDVIETISTYQGGTAATAFDVYTTDATADTLTKLDVLRGYIVKTKSTAFSTSTIANVGTVPAPIKMTLKVGIKAGDLPPSQGVITGYNLVSPLTERNTLVERFLSGVSVPTKVWVSLLGFENQLTYVASNNSVSVVLGAFKGKFEGETVEPGKAEWLFLNANGTITPTLE